MRIMARADRRKAKRQEERPRRYPVVAGPWMRLYGFVSTIRDDVIVHDGFGHDGVFIIIC